MEQAITKGKNQYRFFYHYFKAKKQMSVHFKNTCIQIDDVVCLVPCETKWSIKQPNLVMRGWASNVNIVGNVAYIV